MAVKPLLKETGCVINASDSVENIGDRYYIKSVVSISKGDDSISSVGIARETESKKGMDDAQLSGSCSSYSRKYAICGLLAIDSNPDIDGMNHEEPKYTITEDQKARYQELLHNDAFKGKHREYNNRWRELTTKEQGENALEKMQQKINLFNLQLNGDDEHLSRITKEVV
tara:strand:+ start:2159 stop:2668 length:510 start_codon:yes stop_codon:yes gene_type:complete